MFSVVPPSAKLAVFITRHGFRDATDTTRRRVTLPPLFGAPRMDKMASDGRRASIAPEENAVAGKPAIHNLVRFLRVLTHDGGG